MHSLWALRLLKNAIQKGAVCLDGSPPAYHLSSGFGAGIDNWVLRKRVRDDWRKLSRPIPPGGTYPAKDHCSRCGLCDTYYIAHVKNACAFLGDGMSRIESLEPVVHGRGRNADPSDDAYFGVHEELLYARKTKPVEGAQWTGIVTTIAVVKANIVKAVVCVQRTPDEVLAAKGVKPTLSPNLNTLALVEAAGVKRLLFCDVGCQVQG